MCQRREGILQVVPPSLEILQSINNSLCFFKKIAQVWAKYLVIFGGYEGVNQVNDLYFLDLGMWAFPYPLPFNVLIK